MGYRKAGGQRGEQGGAFVMKEIHFFESVDRIFAGTTYCRDWRETDKQINDGVDWIATTQMGCLSTVLFERGYRIFVHPAEGKSYEIKLGQNTCTQKEIRLAHNLFKMWQAGAFSAQ